MVANPEKFQAIFLGTKDNNITINLGPTKINSSKEVKLLGVVIDCKLNFYPHVLQMCKKVSAKTKALMRIRSYLTQKQADFLFNAYLMSPFNYCPLVWMFCSKQAHNLLNATHHKALCAKLNTFTFTFDEMLLKSNSLPIHTKNLQLLVIEIFKSLNHLSPELMWNSFTIRPASYNLRHGSSLIVPRARSTRALNSFDFRAALAWNHLHSDQKREITLSGFRSSLKKHQIYCRCKNCV